MDKLSVIGKIGTILSDLKKQQEYFSNNLQAINEVEVELFAASANYLAEYAKVLKMLPVSRTAAPMIPAEAAAKAAQQDDDDDDKDFHLNIEAEELVPDDKKIHQVTEGAQAEGAQSQTRSSPVQAESPQAPGKQQAPTGGSPVQAESPQATEKPQTTAAPGMKSAFTAEESTSSPGAGDSPAPSSGTLSPRSSDAPPTPSSVTPPSPTSDQSSGAPAAHRPGPSADRLGSERTEKPPVSPEPVAPIADAPAHRHSASPVREKPAETEKPPVSTGQHQGIPNATRQPSTFRQETANPPAAQTPESTPSTEKPEQGHSGSPSPANDSAQRPAAPASANDGQQTAQAEQQRKVSLNERFGEKKSTLYERIAPQQPQQQTAGSPIPNLGRSIGINERYYFIKTLFQDDKVAFDQAITRIDICHSLGEALEYTNKSLAGKYNWSRKEDDARKFYDLLKRRFV